MTHIRRIALFLLIVFCMATGCSMEAEVTFSEHIAPIVHHNCTPCHRPGEAGPFPLITYQDVRKRAKTIEDVTARRIMPPWPADPSYRHFAGERILSDTAIALIARWVKQGCPIGDTSKIAPLPAFPSGSQIGKPDLVIKMKKPVPIKGNNKDHFYVVKIPFELPQDTFARIIEFVPGNRKLLHHMNGHLVVYEEGKKKNIYGGEYMVDQEAHLSMEIHRRLDLPNDDGSYPALTPSVCNYLPGVSPAVYPDPIGGVKLPEKGCFYLKDIHYGPSPVDTSDLSAFNIFFAPGPPERPVGEFQLGTLGISEIEPPLVIPPNTIKTFHTSTVVPIDISILTVNPHMHLLGKSFLAYATTPQGDTIRLIRINRWDFRWQYFYTFPAMVKIPKGSRIYAEGTFDNTSSNPNNPFNPPRTVSERDGSMRTTDEMFQLIVTYVPYKEGDENVRLGERKTE